MPARIVRIRRLAPIRTDEQLQDEFDALMTLACNGDRRALGAIAIALTPALLGETRAELGGLERHAPGVVAEALTTISEGAGDFDLTRERASVWMKRFVREIARTHLARLMALRSSPASAHEPRDHQGRETTMNDKIKKLTRDDVQALHDVHGTSTRDQASELLGGDPIQAELVTQHLFRSMIGMPVDFVASAEKLAAWTADEVVRLCLVQTGNREVVDWEGYLLRHPEEKPKKKKRALAGDTPVATRDVIPLRRRAEMVPVTRNAREQLQAREEKAVTPRAGVEPDGPDVPRS